MASKEDIIEVCKTILDPDIYIDIWTLGLIYQIQIEGRKLHITMTFTSVGCPAGPQLVQQVKEKTEALPDIDETGIEVVFQPPWEPSEELKAMMGIS